jgi:hypothetical protein
MADAAADAAAAAGGESSAASSGNAGAGGDAGGDGSGGPEVEMAVAVVRPERGRGSRGGRMGAGVGRGGGRAGAGRVRENLVVDDDENMEDREGGNERGGKKQRVVVEEDDPERTVEQEISRNADGWPNFPLDHQPTYMPHGENYYKPCNYGDRQDINQPPFVRMQIPENEMLWRSSVSEKLYVRQEDEVLCQS